MSNFISKSRERAKKYLQGDERRSKKTKSWLKSEEVTPCNLCSHCQGTASTFPAYPQDMLYSGASRAAHCQQSKCEDMTQPVPQTGKYAWLSVGGIVQLRSVYPHLSNMVLQLMDKAFKVSKQSISKQFSFSNLLKSATGTTWGQMEEKYNRIMTGFNNSKWGANKVTDEIQCQ